MAIDEKKAILRGLSVAAQEVRDEAASPDKVARVEASHRAADTRYRLLSAPLLVLPLLLSLLAVAWEQFRFYNAGRHWASHVTATHYVHEGILLIAAGLVLCGATFGLWWLFKDVARRPMRVIGIIAGILAAVLPMIGIFFHGVSFDLGRSAAYQQINYAELVAAARTLRHMPLPVSSTGARAIGEEDPIWSTLPPAIQNIKGARVYILDKGFALELDNDSYDEIEGLLVPANMSELSAEGLINDGQRASMELISREPPVIRFSKLETDAENLNAILNGTPATKPIAWP